MGKKKDLEMLLVGSKTKEALKGDGKNTLNVSGDALDALNEVIHDLVERARLRCSENGRKTVRPSDF
jgi:histone H3/H4